MARVLLFAQETDWYSASLLPRLIAERGLHPVALAPHGTTWLDAPELVGYRSTSMRGRALRAALQAAVHAWRPRLLLPCDDRSAVLATEWLVEATRPFASSIGHGLRGLLRQSLGPGPYRDRLSRSGFAKACARAKIASPAQTDVSSLVDARAAVSRLGGIPVVLKSEGSTAGGGVRLVRNADEGEAAWRSLFPQASGAAVAQQFVEGVPAMATFAAREGRLLSVVSAEKVETYGGPFGPSKEVRLIEDAAMTNAVAKFARAVGFTGIGSVDFIRRDCGEPVAIEFNPRGTRLVGHIAGNLI